MKFFQFVQAVAPVVPGGLARAPYLRNLISMFTTVPEDDWATNRDPSVLPLDATLDAMCSRDRDFTKKYANAFYSRLDLEAFIDRLADLDLLAQQQIVDNFAAFGCAISAKRMPEEVATQLVEILRDKAKLKDNPTQILRQVQITAAKKRMERQVLLRQRGCANCGGALTIESHGVSKECYQIVFLERDSTEFDATDFCALCPACAAKFSLTHTDADVEALRDKVRQLALAEQIDSELAPLGLDPRIRALLEKINDLDIDELSLTRTYSVYPLKEKLSEAALVRRCRDHMAIYETTVGDQQIPVIDLHHELSASMATEDFIDTLTLLLTLGRLQLDIDSGVVSHAH